MTLGRHRIDPDESVYIFYGISRYTFKVEEVSSTRGNILSKPSSSGVVDRRIVPAGLRPQEAVAQFFNLAYVVPILVSMRDTEFSQQKIAELEILALKMKEDAHLP